MAWPTRLDMFDPTPISMSAPKPVPASPTRVDTQEEMDDDAVTEVIDTAAAHNQKVWRHEEMGRMLVACGREALHRIFGVSSDGENQPQEDDDAVTEVMAGDTQGVEDLGDDMEDTQGGIHDMDDTQGDVEGRANGTDDDTYLTYDESGDGEQRYTAAEWRARQSQQWWFWSDGGMKGKDDDGESSAGRSGKGGGKRGARGKGDGS